MFEVIDVLIFPSANTFYISILLSLFLFYFFQADATITFTKRCSYPLINHVDFIHTSSQTTIRVGASMVIHWLHKAVKKFEPDDDDESTISSVS